MFPVDGSRGGFFHHTTAHDSAHHAHGGAAAASPLPSASAGSPMAGSPMDVVRPSSNVAILEVRRCGADDHPPARTIPSSSNDHGAAAREVDWNGGREGLLPSPAVSYLAARKRREAVAVRRLLRSLPSTHSPPSSVAMGDDSDDDAHSISFVSLSLCPRPPPSSMSWHGMAPS